MFNILIFLFLTQVQTIPAEIERLLFAVSFMFLFVQTFQIGFKQTQITAAQYQTFPLIFFKQRLAVGFSLSSHIRSLAIVNMFGLVEAFLMREFLHSDAQIIWVPVVVNVCYLFAIGCQVAVLQLTPNEREIE